MIREAEAGEATEILSQDGVKERLLVEPTEVKNGQSLIVNDRMLLVLIEHTKDIVEAHIAEPRKHWKHLYSDIEAVIEYCQYRGYKQIFTSVRSELKTTLNLAKKHGFKVYNQIGSEVILKWA